MKKTAKTALPLHCLRSPHPPIPLVWDLFFAVFLGAAWQSDVTGPDPGGQTVRRPQGGVAAGGPHLALRQGWGNVTLVLIGHGVIDFSLQNFGIDVVHDEILFAQ